MEPRETDGKLAGLIAGLVLCALGIIMAVSTAGMQVGPAYSKVGPQVFPYAAAVSLAALGAVFVWRALKIQGGGLPPDAVDVDWRAVGLISGGFIFEILTIETLGFVISSAALFMAVAFAFGSRRFLRDGISAVGLSLGAYLVFTRLLNLQLPAGLHAGLF